MAEISQNPVHSPELAYRHDEGELTFPSSAYMPNLRWCAESPVIDVGGLHSEGSAPFLICVLWVPRYGKGSHRPALCRARRGRRRRFACVRLLSSGASRLVHPRMTKESCAAEWRRRRPTESSVLSARARTGSGRGYCEPRRGSRTSGLGFRFPCVLP